MDYLATTNKVTPSLNFWQRTSREHAFVATKRRNCYFNRDDVREPYTILF